MFVAIELGAVIKSSDFSNHPSIHILVHVFHTALLTSVDPGANGYKQGQICKPWRRTASGHPDGYVA